MALTITSITPSRGSSAGRDRVVIEGTDFDIHPYPPVGDGFIGDLGDSVTVRFGVMEAENVAVYPKVGGGPGETVIECNAPRYVGDPDLLRSDPNTAFVDVSVENLLNPETVTEVDGYQYFLESVTSSNPSVLKCVTDALYNEIERQIPVRYVVGRTHTDYDADTGDGLNTVRIADVPALLIDGPRISDADAVYREHFRDEEVTTDDFRECRERDVCNLEYTIEIIDDNQTRLLNLMNLLTIFVHENGQLPVENTPGTPADGFAYLDMEWVDKPGANLTASKDNLISSTGVVVIQGVPLDRALKIELGQTQESTTITVDTRNPV